MSTQSCIINRFEELAVLSEGDKRLLEGLEKDLRQYPAGQVLRSVGETNPPFYTLRSGWACSVRLLPDGQRQILEIFVDGQIMGLADVGADQALTELVALTDIEACPFPAEDLYQVFEESSLLTRLLFMTMARDQALLMERIMNIGRRKGVERLAHFLLELKIRKRCRDDAMELPLNQSVIGDALGMSSVHVSRSMSGLRKLGLLSTEGNYYRIADMNAAAKFCGFCPKYLDPGHVPH
ncbi:MAG: Crp/Fnr family transcriptional regulator [Wenzhouxiangella sp.]